MTRMGKSVPEPATISMGSAPLKTSSFVPASAGTSAVKKVYCAPKINFVGELLPMYT